MRQELRTESLNQLKDVAGFFVQQLKSNKVAHAEVQTGPSMINAAVQVGVGVV